jgi:hypothetical protein
MHFVNVNMNIYLVMRDALQQSEHESGLDALVYNKLLHVERTRSLPLHQPLKPSP